MKLFIFQILFIFSMAVYLEKIDFQKEYKNRQATWEERNQKTHLINPDKIYIKKNSFLISNSKKKNRSPIFLSPLPEKSWWLSQGIHGKNAVDMAAKSGTPVSAAADGIIEKTAYDRVSGKYIKIRHKDGIKTIYCHLKKILVKEGDKIKGGEKIGLVGNTGRTKGKTGNHLHFGVIGATNPFANQRLARN